ncbi:MAG: XdhC family protein, partial [Bacteroidota bacterium]|nr:XdhC family protein [Bacteroidota bacterium]
MKETNDILQSYERAKWEGKKCALATVVHVEGSSYRRPGARMLIADDGQLTGAISGGCLEGDALRKALFAITQGENKLVTYDTTQADDLQFGVQLGCDGI